MAIIAQVVVAIEPQVAGGLLVVVITDILPDPGLPDTSGDCNIIYDLRY